MATAKEKPGGSWQSKLEKEGYAVLSGVLTKSEVDTARWDHRSCRLAVNIEFSQNNPGLSHSSSAISSGS